MKWIVVLIGLVILYFMWAQDEPKNASKILRISDRNDLNLLRAKSEHEMSISEIEQYAKMLGDEELWRELESGIQSWLEENGEHGSLPYPRLLFQLASEFGAREGETGIFRVMDVLRQIDDTSHIGINTQIERMLPNMVFSGWAEKDPEAAIRRLIQSNIKEEEKWPVFNKGYLMYFKLPGYFVMEGIFRQEFAKMAQQDLEKSFQLFLEGANSWVVDPSQVVEVFFLQGLASKTWLDAIGAMDEVSPGAKKTWLKSWTPESYLEAFQDGRGRFEELDIIVRNYPEKIGDLVSDNNIPSDLRRDLMKFALVYDLNHLSLLRDFPGHDQKELLNDLTSYRDEVRWMMGLREGDQEGFHYADRFFDRLQDAAEESGMNTEDRQEVLKSIEDARNRSK